MTLRDILFLAILALGIWSWTPIGQRTSGRLFPYVLHLSWSREFGLSWWIEKVDRP